jgi:hypothetical protein
MAQAGQVTAWHRAAAPNGVCAGQTAIPGNRGHGLATLLRPSQARNEGSIPFTRSAQTAGETGRKRHPLSKVCAVVLAATLSLDVGTATRWAARSGATCTGDAADRLRS